MADRIITVTNPSIVTNDTLSGYNNYSDIDGQLGTTMTPTEATNGHTVALSDGVSHQVTTKPVGTTNGEFSAVISNAVTVDLAGGTPIEPVYTLSDLTKSGNDYTAGSAGWSNMGITTTPIGSGDFEYYIDLLDVVGGTTNRPMIGLSTDGTNRSFSTAPAWEITAYSDTIFKVLVDGASDATLTEESDALSTSAMVLKRVGSTITFIQRELAGDTTIHTFSTPAGGALSGNVYLHICQNNAGELVQNPLYLQQ